MAGMAAAAAEEEEEEDETEEPGGNDKNKNVRENESLGKQYSTCT